MTIWPAVALVCLLLGGFLKLPEAIQSPGSDTGMFATYGAMLLRGARPYVDFWDVHPPLVFAYWAVVQALSGSDWLRACVSIDWLAPVSCSGLVAHTLDLLLSVAAALVVAAIVRRSGGATAAAVLGALFVVGFADQAILSQEGSTPSKLTLLPSSAAVWAYLVSLNNRRVWRWAVAAGVAGALAGLAKQPALLTLAALAGYGAWHRDRTRLAGLLVGSGAAFLLTCTALALVGSLGGFIAEAWAYNLDRIFVGYFVHPVKAPVIGLNRVLGESAGLLATLAVIGGLVITRAPLHSSQRLLAWWGLVTVISITAFREFVYAVPSFAVLGAVGFERIWVHVQSRAIARSMLVVLCAVVIVLTTSFQRVQLARARFERGPGGWSPTEELGLIIRRDLPPGPLFIYGNGAQMYVLAHRTPASRYLNAEALRSTAPGSGVTRTDLVAELRDRPPPIVVLAPHSDEAELNLAEFPAMGDFVEECYVLWPLRPEIAADWRILLRTAECARPSSERRLIA